eukprot:COSAG02_NODE_2206_length_9517_cov_3.928860_2_plen_68_part_00
MTERTAGLLAAWWCRHRRYPLPSYTLYQYTPLEHSLVYTLEAALRSPGSADSSASQWVGASDALQMA